PAHAPASDGFGSYERPSYQDDWPQQPQQDSYQNGRPAQYAPETESSQAGDASERNRVGFDRPGPASPAANGLTDAGLPRRRSVPSGSNGSSAPNGTARVQRETPAPTPRNTPAAGDDSAWRSANDERWQQASQLRKPKAGGVTSSGLPRR